MSELIENIKFKVPEHACDCHHHIIQDVIRYPVDPQSGVTLENEPVDKYIALKKQLGIERDVVVSIAAYGYDNSNVLAALKILGKNTTKAIITLNDQVTDQQLDEYQELGVRGIRVWNRFPFNFQYLEKLAPRLAERGWHACLFPVSADDIVSWDTLLQKLPIPIVFDHLGNIPAEKGENQPAFRVIGDLLDKGKGWVKISGVQVGDKAPNFERKIALSQKFIQINPEHIIWGSDWPHMGNRVPDAPRCADVEDTHLFNLLAEQAPDEKIRHKILVENPEKLYGFDE